MKKESFCKQYRNVILSLKLKLKKLGIPQTFLLFFTTVFLFAQGIRYFFDGSFAKSSTHSNSHAFLVCESNEQCCENIPEESLRSIIDQTLQFSTVTVFHNCSSSSFIANTRQKSKEISREVYKYNTRILEQTCDLEDLQLCVLNKLKELYSNPDHKSTILMLDTSHVLQAVANENVLLYLSLRPKLSAARLIGYSDKTSQEVTVNKNHINFLPLAFTGQNDFGIHSAQLKLKYDFSKGFLLYSSLAFLQILSKSRLIRTPLLTHNGAHPCTSFCAGTMNADIWNIADSYNMLRPYLFSDEVYYKWSARIENDEQYSRNLEHKGTNQLVDVNDNFDFLGNAMESKMERTQLMIFVPAFRVGGSEQSILQLAQAAVSKKWKVTLLLTMAHWELDSFGEAHIKNEWIEKARTITKDVFNLVEIGQNDNFSRLLRYFIESRDPEYIFASNSVSIYRHMEFIRAIAPDALIMDYNHMVDRNLNLMPELGPGGFPRLAAYYSEQMDVHFSASNNVNNALQEWIDPNIIEKNPEKVKTCYIGTNSDFFHNEADINDAREKWRVDHGIEQDRILVLFVGRWVHDKGVDVICNMLRKIASDSEIAKKLHFHLIGSGPLETQVNSAFKSIKSSELKASVDSSVSLPEDLKNAYAGADMLLLPSRIEGIALVLYEAMASGLLVMTTNVGGQSELVNSDTGILLPPIRAIKDPARYILDEIKIVLEDFSKFDSIRENAMKLIKDQYTTALYSKCIMEKIEKTKKAKRRSYFRRKPNTEHIDEMSYKLVDAIDVQRDIGKYSLNSLTQPIESLITIGIKTYICDSGTTGQVRAVVRAIRNNYPNVKIFLGNDGPLEISTLDFVKDDPNTEEIRMISDVGISRGRNILVSLTETEFFVLMDDDHIFDETGLEKAVHALKQFNFDIVGFRVYNSPGMYELEMKHVLIPRYVSLISKFEDRNITLCFWNENEGPSVHNMHVPLRVDVIHNVFLAKTRVLQENPWRNELKVNEHMTFFLDARREKLRIGYLPSVYVHHRTREYSTCYKNIRFREDKFRELLDYKDKYLWDRPCGYAFPNRVATHLEETELDGYPSKQIIEV